MMTDPSDTEAAPLWRRVAMEVVQGCTWIGVIALLAPCTCQGCIW